METKRDIYITPGRDIDIYMAHNIGWWFRKFGAHRTVLNQKGQENKTGYILCSVLELGNGASESKKYIQ